MHCCLCVVVCLFVCCECFVSYLLIVTIIIVDITDFLIAYIDHDVCVILYIIIKINIYNWKL